MSVSFMQMRVSSVRCRVQNVQNFSWVTGVYTLPPNNRKSPDVYKRQHQGLFLFVLCTVLNSVTSDTIREQYGRKLIRVSRLLSKTRHS